MLNGISIYPGLDNTLEENLDLIRKASRVGLKRIFTSLHIPETNRQALKRELMVLLEAARHEKMEIISDISPVTLEMLGLQDFRLSAFRMFGIGTLRFDYGYGAEEIAKYSRNRQHIRIQLNASTMTGKILKALMDNNANFDNIDALHNFYPRPGTGLSEETLVRKTVMLHKAGVRVSAFVPSHNRRRGPLFEGLPTMEAHRDMNTGLAARHLAALGVDSIIIGDSMPSDDELISVSQTRNDEVVVRARLITEDSVQKELLSHTFTSRIDEARDVIRAQESRKLVKASIVPEPPRPRTPGSITVDNETYPRYMGELEIIRRAQPADSRTNVVAHVSEDEAFLLDYITPGRRFSFDFQETPRKIS